MFINRVSNLSFCGNLYLHNKKYWTEDMKRAVSENESIQRKLQDHDIIGDLSVKVERLQTYYPARHSKGDLIYKLNFTVQKEGASLMDKLKNSADVKKYVLCSHYHSEITTVDRIRNLNMD